MSTKLENLQKEKTKLEKKIEKVKGIANARVLQYKEIYDEPMIPYLATSAFLMAAGETFVNVKDNLDDNIATHSKVAYAVASGVNYAIAGAAASVIAVGTLPIAALESVYSIPLAAYNTITRTSKLNYNDRIYKAKNKLNKLQSELGRVNSEIQNETQGLERA